MTKDGSRVGPVEGDQVPPANADSGSAAPDRLNAPDAPASQAPDVDELVQAVRKPPVRRDVDPEDWASGRGSDDERYLRERPPHWE